MDHAHWDQRILIVENEYILAMELKRSLRKAGAMVLGPVPSDLALELTNFRAPRPHRNQRRSTIK